MTEDKQSFFERLTGSVVSEEPIPTSPAAEPEPPQSDLDANEDEREHDETDVPEPNNAPETTAPNEQNGEGHLTVDVYQTPTHIVVQAPMAGVKPDDVDVSINNDMITIRGTRHLKDETDSNSYYYREVFWGPFSRSVLMPYEVDSNKVEASFKNGLLTVKMPKVIKEEVQRVKIQTKEI